jgi:hypothetical protein
VSLSQAQRFAHANQLRADRALHALLGMSRFPSDDTILNYFRRFSQAEIERFWRPLWRWLISRLPGLASGYSLDLDSTIFARHGTQQQGAARGYNPRRPGRLSHHPLLAVLAEANFVLHAWLRSGNTGAGQGAEQFLGAENRGHISMILLKNPSGGANSLLSNLLAMHFD